MFAKGSYQKSKVTEIVGFIRYLPQMPQELWFHRVYRTTSYIYCIMDMLEWNVWSSWQAPLSTDPVLILLLRCLIDNLIRVGNIKINHQAWNSSISAGREAMEPIVHGWWHELHNYKLVGDHWCFLTASIYSPPPQSARATLDLLEEDLAHFGYLHPVTLTRWLRIIYWVFFLKILRAGAKDLGSRTRKRARTIQLPTWGSKTFGADFQIPKRALQQQTLDVPADTYYD